MDISPYVAYPGAILAVVSLVALAWTLVARLGRPYVRRRNLRRLSYGVPISRFEELLGQPILRRQSKSHQGHVVHVFRLPEAYVAAATPEEGYPIDAFAITLRKLSVRLALKPYCLPMKDLALPLSFGSVPRTLQRHGLRCIVGANRYGYGEAYYFGNPGRYCNYILAHNDAGPGVFRPGRAEAFSTGILKFDSDEYVRDAPRGDWFEAFQRSATVNTFAVVAPDIDLSLIATGLSFGVERGFIAQVPE